VFWEHIPIFTIFANFVRTLCVMISLRYDKFDQTKYQQFFQQKEVTCACGVISFLVRLQTLCICLNGHESSNPWTNMYHSSKCVALYAWVRGSGKSGKTKRADKKFSTCFSFHNEPMVINKTSFCLHRVH